MRNSVSKICLRDIRLKPRESTTARLPLDSPCGNNYVIMAKKYFKFSFLPPQMTGCVHSRSTNYIGRCWCIDSVRSVIQAIIIVNWTDIVIYSIIIYLNFSWIWFSWRWLTFWLYIDWGNSNINPLYLCFCCSWFSNCFLRLVNWLPWNLPLFLQILLDFGILANCKL